MRLFPALLLLVTLPCAIAQTKPIEIKVVVINMFEQGADTGDIPGEYQYWVEREHLDTVMPNPSGRFRSANRTATSRFSIMKAARCFMWRTSVVCRGSFANFWKRS